MNRVWLLQVLIAFDQFLNAVLFGWADETFSARCYRRGTLQENKYFRTAQFFIDGLFFWTTDHCKKSWVSEVEREQLPRSMRLDRNSTEISGHAKN